MNSVCKLSLKLLLLTAVAGLALGATNALTQGPIAAQEEASANAARAAVLSQAVDFQAMPGEADGLLADVYEGLDASGQRVGLTGKTVVSGFGGPIEIIIGVDVQGVITGISIGGSDFAETAGLGARTKEPGFTGQFAGQAAPVELKQNGGQIDAVTSATVSSSAVTKGVSQAAAALSAILGK